MNKTSIKNYAIWARNELISRVSQKAFEYGVEKDNIVSSNANDINGRLLSNDEKKKRQILIKEVNQKGFDQVMEEVAYTWFNRFIALRFMEVNNYLPKKVRVFTNDNNEFKPQIMDEALHIELSGLDKNKVISLKEANNNEGLYKELLLATCNDMSRYLPGMFKPISDYMTLLFPTNLLREQSILGRLVSDIDEDSWTDQVQIIGWLYQSYIAESKDILINAHKKYQKTEIPAVTQLFTPDWIVCYMTENTLGRLWIDGHPNTEIKSNWKYYLDEAEQEESVQIELNKIKAEHAKLRPEDIKFLDPCMGSGHILVYAFDVFMQIYVSEGWTEREAAKSILQNNIYGLDIDERAYQLSYFALMMKARQYNRRILSEGIVPNVMAIEESNTFNKELLRRFGDLKSLAEKVVNIFIDAKEYGSILNVEFTKEEMDSLEAKLNEIDKMADYGNLLDQLESDQLYHDFYQLLKQARIMSQKYECVVTNPPYMNSSYMPNNLKAFVLENYNGFKGDLFATFIIKSIDLLKDYGHVGILTPYVWMFIASYETLRKKIIESASITSLVQLEYNAFEAACVPVCSFTMRKGITDTIGEYVKLSEFRGVDNQSPKLIDAINNKECGYRYSTSGDVYKQLPSYLIAYWASKSIVRSFGKKTVAAILTTREGMATADNDRFLRLWSEVPYYSIGWNVSDETESLDSNCRWFPYNKGGDYRKWYGNNDYVVDWENNGERIRNNIDIRTKRVRSHNYNGAYSFKKGITWSALSSSNISVRFSPEGFLFDSKGAKGFSENENNLYYALGLINSKVGLEYLSFISPTIDFKVGDIIQIPLIEKKEDMVTSLVKESISISKTDWDSFETSWDFTKHPLVRGFNTVKESYKDWDKECKDRFNQLKSNEEELNRIFIDTYGLQDELTSEVEDKDITVRKADLQREIKSLISYAVGCMFGRYSLDVDGLAYAGGQWDDNKYKSFIPDKDNVVPICDDEYFEDDIVGRFIEFIITVYGEDTLEENLQFIADVLGGKGTSREVIRNYFIKDFFIDHCNTYQVTGSGKRPIYWQFDSGKKNGFKALVYVHRYTPDLIARIRTDYVHEQQSKYDNQIEMITNQISSVTTTAEKAKLNKQLKKYKEQSEELRIYEEKIHHWADKMEPMDMDDGIKKNYAKFQELLSKIK